MLRFFYDYIDVTQFDNRMFIFLYVPCYKIRHTSVS